MRKSFALLAAAAAIGLAAAAPAHAASKTEVSGALGYGHHHGPVEGQESQHFVLINGDPAGVGFNDPTPAAPIGGNPGATVGEQRLKAYERAFELWSAVLDTDVPILVLARWLPLSCSPTSGVLGSAGPNFIFRDFANAPLAGHWYHGALAEKLAGADLAGADVPDIITQFNVNLGTPTCLTASGWYYGLDNNEPAGQIDFLSVLLHEVAHGLGFSNFVNEGTGALLAGFPDVYSAFTLDTITGKQWNDPTMTDAERAASGVSVNRMVWNGTTVVANAPHVLDSLLQLNISAPPAAAGDYDIGNASFGPPATPANFSGAAAYAEDGVGATNDACEPITNGGVVSGKIAIVDRGTCAFTLKAANVQAAGATGMLLVNNVAGAIALGGADPTITIPSVGVTNTVGPPIKAAGGAATLGLFESPTLLAGADASGFPKLYAPVVYSPGSSGSHFDVTHVPNALMEPFISSDLPSATNVDLTPGQFEDIGWDIGPFAIGKCVTRVPAVTKSGDILLGPVLQCRDAAASQPRPERAELRCTRAYVRELRMEHVLTRYGKRRLIDCLLDQFYDKHGVVAEALLAE